MKNVMIQRAGIGLAFVAVAMVARYLFGPDDALVQQLTSSLAAAGVLSQVLRRAGDKAPEDPK
jgi:hypothetical protein